MKAWGWALAISGWIVGAVVVATAGFEVDWGFLGGKQADAPWVATSVGEILGSLAIVVAAVSGSWLTGRWAHRGELARQAAAEARAEREQEARRVAELTARQLQVADRRAERLRVAYAAFLVAHSELKMALLAAVATRGSGAPKSKVSPLLEAALEANQNLEKAGADLILVSTPQVMFAVMEVQSDFQRLALDALQGDGGTDGLDLKPHTMALVLLTGSVWQALKDLDEGNDFEMTVDAEALSADR